jgi:hypothetical protein
MAAAEVELKSPVSLFFKAGFSPRNPNLFEKEEKGRFSDGMMK